MSIERVFLFLVVFALLDLLPHTILQLHVPAFLLDELVKLDWLVKLIFGVGLRWFVQSRLSDSVHHFAVLGRKLVLNFAF